MKKMRRFLAALVAMVMVMATPVMAGEWQYPMSGGTEYECHYLKDNGKYAAFEYVTIDGVTYYFDCTGSLLANNYAPDGRWINANGNVDTSVPTRTTDVYPKSAMYEWTDGIEYITLSIYYHDNYDDGVSIGEVVMQTSSPYAGTFYTYYNLIYIGNGTFGLADTSNQYYAYYMTVSGDGNTIRTSYEGNTTVYTYSEDLIYS